MKVFFEAFLNLQFGFVTFCQNNIGAKADLLMLVKLTTGLILYVENCFNQYVYMKQILENFTHFHIFLVKIELLYWTKKLIFCCSTNKIYRQKGESKQIFVNKE
jgi:hypothetical protein